MTMGYCFRNMFGGGSNAPPRPDPDAVRRFDTEPKYPKEGYTNHPTKERPQSSSYVHNERPSQGNETPKPSKYPERPPQSSKYPSNDRQPPSYPEVRRPESSLNDRPMSVKQRLQRPLMSSNSRYPGIKANITDLTENIIRKLPS